MDDRLSTRVTTALTDRRRPVRLVAAVSWHATGVTPRPTDVYRLDRRAATGLSDTLIRGRHDDDGILKQVGSQQHAVVRRRARSAGD